MKLRTFFVTFFLSIAALTFSQNADKKILLTIDDEPVYMDEFTRVYEKNLEMVQDENQRTKEAYLDLFVNYKLKTKEAYSQELHLNPAFIKEFNSYRNQLANNYLYEQDITEELMLEAYERLQEEINASHILIRLSLNSTPKDTLDAYNKILEIREKAIAGQDFETLAKEYSEEPNAKESGGSLGYFKGLGMVYPFETAAYNTPVGGVSDVIRTQFGYHILKVNGRRPVSNEVTVAHIMIANKNDGNDEAALQRINEILNRVNQGEDFGDLARQFSEDQGSARNGGLINRFGSGRLNAPIFEETSFNLKNPGDISEPVKTNFGWHIIKLIERHPKESYEESKDELFRRVKSSDRSKVIVKSVNESIKEKYNFKEIENPLPFFNTFVTDSLIKRKWQKTSHPSDLDKIAFKIGNKEYLFSDFANFIEEHQKKGAVSNSKVLQLQKYYDQFQEMMLDEFFKISLEEENQEFSNLLSEYKDGLLIYDLMQKNIWEPSKTDTIGMNTYFENNRESYIWNTRVKGLIASTSDKKIANQIKKMLNKNATVEDIKDTFNTEEVINVILTEGTFEMENSILPSNFKTTKGVSKVYDISTEKSTNSSQFIVVKVEDIIPQSYKELDEVRGRVMSDYQSHLEKEWMKELHEKYNVTINKSVLN
ncbi:MAG: peptidylprolyl isomerase [Flavobacteriaceae bacterium]|nr:peptidylprolyl isomerase [Flavobacteriaceae bacterium]